MRRKEGEGFTIGRDPTGGVFEEKLFLMKKFFSTILSFSTKIWRYLGFQKTKFSNKTDLELSTIFSYASIVPHLLIGVVCEYI